MEGHDKQQMAEWIQASARIGRLDEAPLGGTPAWLTDDDADARTPLSNTTVQQSHDCGSVLMQLIQYLLKDHFGGNSAQLEQVLRRGVAPSIGVWGRGGNLRRKGLECGLLEARPIAAGQTEQWFTPKAAIQAINLLREKAMSISNMSSASKGKPFDPTRD